jgi:hypothetical protein
MTFTGGELPPNLFEIVEGQLGLALPDFLSLETTISNRLTDGSSAVSSSRIIDGTPVVLREVPGDATPPAQRTQTDIKFSLVRVDDGDVWNFICAPTSVKWNKSGEISTVNAYGTNAPTVIYSSTSLRQLTLSEVIVEGFTFGNQVENVILKLESMMRMVANTSEGFISPYVWSLRAADSSYGLYIISTLDVEEVLRDTKGKATRAIVSLQLQEIGAHQVDTGRDLAAPAEIATPDQAALDALVPDEEKDATNGTGDGGNGVDKGDSDSTASKVSIDEGLGGYVVSRGESTATCSIDKANGVCLANTERDVAAFKNIGFTEGRELGKGITLIFPD